MDIKINLEISVTPTLEGLLKSLAGGQSGQPEAVRPETPAKPEKKPEKAESAPDPKPEETGKPDGGVKTQTPDGNSKKPGSLEWLQEAMDWQFRRLLGDDYKTEPGKQGLRRQVAKCFKLIAAGIDGDATKPSELKTQEDKEKFVVEMDNIEIIDDKGVLSAEYRPF